ncbi:ileal sodium/bile acid cotransporter-like protein 3 [Dinothrombium tinctorium]|uniref:Ileal sodium/bile acid cotransporter-like protein 3 n=1 Tax=Dinothrombium tinctorium TaxID=1965070 RepID=A0A3S3Q5P5_9ACAR|nr:ileal sodium/bile acid cotransporter-like protein 3 [Dinothrombium tinctorium]
MTTMSTIMALVMMPLNIWMYGHSLENDTIVIPYKKMALSLCFLTAPVLLGMLVLWKLPRAASILAKIGSIAGFAIIIVCQALEILIFPDIFDDVPFQIYVAEILLPLLGLSLGYSLASIFGLSYAQRRTIAIESGIQNIGTALAIVSLSYPFHQLRKVWLFPFMYAFSMLGICIVMAVIFQLQKKFVREKFDIAGRDKNTLKASNPHCNGTRKYHNVFTFPL